jgi:hypothetical protein
MFGRLRTRALIGALVALWVAGTCAGFAHLMRYATTSGNDGPAPTDWPAASTLQPDPDRANLVLLAHPHCSCTRATFQQLEQLAARCPSVAIHVLFVRPAESGDDWKQTDLWRQAAAIPTARVIEDTGGAEARRFGAATSGCVLLYRRDGKLLFRGGITDARGQAGDSAGVEAIVSLLISGAAERDKTPVFGCPLFDPTPSTDQGPPTCCKD